MALAEVRSPSRSLDFGRIGGASLPLCSSLWFELLFVPNILIILLLPPCPSSLEIPPLPFPSHFICKRYITSDALEMMDYVFAQEAWSHLKSLPFFVGGTSLLGPISDSHLSKNSVCMKFLSFPSGGIRVLSPSLLCSRVALTPFLI